MSLLARAESLRGVSEPVVIGTVTRVVGLVVEGTLPRARIGDVCEIGELGCGRHAEVVGLDAGKALLVPYGVNEGLRAGAPLRRLGAQGGVGCSQALLGRVITALGEPLDGKPAPFAECFRPLQASPPGVLDRAPVSTPFPTGVRVLDSMLTFSKGMRMGIFAAAGVGKSTLMGSVMRHSVAEVNVVALIGERGREVIEFVEQILGREGLQKSVVVVATSDRSPLERVRAAFAATSIAEFFRDQGQNVLLMMDSLTRLGMAQREIGLSIGEPPTQRGYTPSVFALLPKVLERACPLKTQGSITGLYTVLVEGDDINDPLADSARSLLDGHIVLSRAMAQRGAFPAVDVLASTSRVMHFSVQPQHMKASQQVRETLAIAKEADELMSFGAYQAGKNGRIDHALNKRLEIDKLFRQTPESAGHWGETLKSLLRLGDEGGK